MDTTKKEKRQRAENFSAEEKTVIIELVAKYKSLVENKKSDKVTLQEKHNAWLEIVRKMNNDFPLKNRTVDQIKLLWSNMKRNAKTECAEHRRETFRTGGGPVVPNLSADSDRIASLIPAHIHPLSNEYDNDALVKNSDDDKENISFVGLLTAQNENISTPSSNSNVKESRKSSTVRGTVYSTYEEQSSEYHELRMKKINVENQEKIVESWVLPGHLQTMSVKAPIGSQTHCTFIDYTPFLFLKISASFPPIEI